MFFIYYPPPFSPHSCSPWQLVRMAAARVRRRLFACKTIAFRSNTRYVFFFLQSVLSFNRCLFFFPFSVFITPPTSMATVCRMPVPTDTAPVAALYVMTRVGTYVGRRRRRMERRPSATSVPHREIIIDREYTWRKRIIATTMTAGGRKHGVTADKVYRASLHIWRTIA